MVSKRHIIQTGAPPSHPGFLGKGHTARPVIQREFVESDPFILLMDDVIDKKDPIPVGGPHPHAGFETVTILLEGEIGDETHIMKKGDFQMMTAGSGVIHSEILDKKMKVRLLQLWLNLPRKYRSVVPKLQDLPVEHAPSMNENGVQITLYSGSFAGMTSPVQNYTPLLMADIAIQPDVKTIVNVPADFNTFLFVLSGSVKVGEDLRQLSSNQVGWLNLLPDDEPSELALFAGETGVQFILYAGKPLGETIVSHGPFIADSSDDIKRLYREFRQGKMTNISDAPESQRLFL